MMSFDYKEGAAAVEIIFAHMDHKQWWEPAQSIIPPIVQGLQLMASLFIYFWINNI